MKKSRFSDSQIVAILRQEQCGHPVPELCREHGISSALFYKWQAKFGDAEAPLRIRLQALEKEYQQLKKMYQEKCRKTELIQEVLAKRIKDNTDMPL